MSFSDIDEIANNAVAAEFIGENLFDAAKVLSSITLDDVNERLRSSIDVENCSLAVIKPEGE